MGNIFSHGLSWEILSHGLSWEILSHGSPSELYTFYNPADGPPLEMFLAASLKRPSVNLLVGVPF
jgi:hypothetical protein